MAVARETVRLGLAARAQAKIKVRQPLRAAVIVATGREREAIERLAEHRPRGAQRPRAALRLRGRRARRGRDQAQLPHARPALRQAHADGRGRRGRRWTPGHVAAALRDGRTRGDLRRRQRPRARRRGPAHQHEAAGGLPGRARGLPRRGPGDRDRRRAPGRGLGARHRPRRAERPPGGRASISPTGSCSRWTATSSCSPPPGPTRTTSRPRCWPPQIGYGSPTAPSR